MTATTVTRLTRPGTAFDPTSAVAQGARDMMPFAVSLIPFAIAIGAETAAVGHSMWTGLAAAILMLGGSAQLAVVGLMDDGAGVGAMLATATLINLRFVLFSAGMSRWFRTESLRRRLAVSVMVVDPTYLVTEKKFTENPGLQQSWRNRYYAAGAVLLAVTFVFAQPIGHLLGGSLPGGVGLELAAPLAFVSMLAGGVRGRRELVAAGVAVAAVLLFAGAPAGAGVPVAAVVGMIAGTMVAVPDETAEIEEGTES